MILALLLAHTSAAACPGNASAVEVQRHLDRALVYYEQLEPEPFRTEAEAAREMADCVEDQLEPSLVAQLHRALGLHAYTREDIDAAVRSFASARRAEPGYALPPTLVPEGHPLRTDYTALDPLSVQLDRVPEPKRGQLFFDGTVALERPADQPTVVQLIGGDDRAELSAYLSPGDPMPSYEAKRLVSPVEKPLIGTAAVGGLMALGTFTGAVLSRGAYQNIDDTTQQGQDALAPARSRTNNLLLASAVGGGIGLTAGISAVAVIVW